MIRFLQTPGPIKKIVLGGILVIICVSMAWYVLPGGSGTSVFGSNTPQKGIVATVAGEDVTTVEVQKQARRMVEQQYPRAGVQASMLMSFYAKPAADNLINEKLMLAEANRMGMQVTDSEVREELEHGPYAATFFPGGKFIGHDEYEGLLRSHDLTIPQFEHLVANGILERKLEKLIASSAAVTDAEVHQQFEKENTKVKFDYAVIKKDDVLKSLHPAEAELKAFYDRNKQTYVNSIPEKRQLKYVVLDNTKMLAQTQVTQQDLAAYYDQRRDEYRVPEQVSARQIVIKKPGPGADGKVDQKAVEQARSKADELLKQIKAGQDFSAVAKKNSEDTGTAKNGGSLGWIKPDAFPVPAVAKAASNLSKGATSDVVDAGYAFVIIHADDKQEAHVKTLDEVKSQIEPILKQQKAGEAAQRAADELLADARGASLEKAASAKGLQVISTDFVTSKDILPGIGSDPPFMTAAFGQAANAPPDRAQLHQGWAIYQVTSVKPPATPTFEEIRSRVEQEFKNERSAQLLTQKTQELSDRAKADHDLKKAAKELGATYKTSDLVLPDGQVPDIGSMTGPAAVAFTLKPGEISGPINSGDTGAVLTVIERQAPTEQEFAAKKDQIRETLLQRKQNEVFVLYLETLRQTMEKSGKIKINQAELQTLTKSRTEESE
jgi:peptidyl-prolyl cis-trans isomerase D